MNTPPDNAPENGTGVPPFAVPHPHLPGVWSGIGAVLLYFLLQFGIALLVGSLTALAIGFGYELSAGIHHVKVDPATIQHLIHLPVTRISTVTITLVVTAVLMLWFIHHYWRSLWALPKPPGFGFTRPDNPRLVLVAILVGLAAVYLGGMLAQTLAGHHAPPQDVSVWAESVPVAFRLPLAVATVCIAPIVEEALFRGVLLSGLMRRMHVGWAVLLSALIFGCAHLPDFRFAWYPIPSLVLFGLLLAWLRLKSNSLWPAIAAHATNNLVAVLAWFVILRP